MLILGRVLHLQIEGSVLVAFLLSVLRQMNLPRSENKKALTIVRALYFPVSGWQNDDLAIYIYDIQYVISKTNRNGHRIGHIKYAFIW